MCLRRCSWLYLTLYSTRHETLITRDDPTDTTPPGDLMQITTFDNSAIVFTSTNGNLYLKPLTDSADPSDTSVFFYGDAGSGLVNFDYNQRFFHIYQPTMTNYGVSRLRLHNITSIPNTSRMVYVHYRNQIDIRS
jgi:hypothetical protein